MIEKLKSAGAVVIGFLIFVVALLAIGLLIGGAGWVSERLLPWFSVASLIALLVIVFILLPLSAFRTTRGFAALVIMYLSFLFGVTVWMEGLLTTLSIWGTGAVVFGLFLGGVGVVPIAMLATLFHGLWGRLGELIGLVVITFGCRFFALWIASKADAAGYAD
ncbi:MAG: hypothetical protein P4L40_10760 [Terracidiphilus sp.]|nr:hypothetical protein [Terracidiphilus sp.]